MASSSSSANFQSDLTHYSVEYEYDGRPRYCDCRKNGRRLKAPRKTSWSEDNPGRRYFVCKFWHLNPSKNKSCGYFEWYDDEMTMRAKDLLNKFKEENEILRAETVQLEKKKKGLGCFDDEMGELWAELTKMKKAHQKMDKEIANANRRRTIAVILSILSWVLLFYVIMSKK